MAAERAIFCYCEEKRMSFKEIANSSLLWIITGIGIAIVVVMILFYLRLCYRKALEMGVEKQT